MTIHVAMVTLVAKVTLVYIAIAYLLSWRHYFLK